MNTVYVVPCGLSVLDQLARKLPSGGSPVTKFTRAIGNGVWLDGVDLDSDDAVRAAWSAHVAAKAEEAGLEGAIAKWLSAETHSLATRVTHGKLTADQHVLLLASDTKKGLTAAFCVAQYLTGFGTDQVRYMSSPAVQDDGWELKVTWAQATVVRVRGLMPVGADFNLAAFGIGKALRAAGDSGAAVEVHLTGGFKATLLHTLAMSEVLHSMAPRYVTAWNVFEDVGDDNPGQPVPPQKVGLRNISHYLSIMRAELTAAKNGASSGSKTFEGMGWTEDAAGKRQLTDFGWGYLAVLGDAASPLGDDNS